MTYVATEAKVDGNANTLAAGIVEGCTLKGRSEFEMEMGMGMGMSVAMGNESRALN